MHCLWAVTLRPRRPEQPGQLVGGLHRSPTLIANDCLLTIDVEIGPVQLKSASLGLWQAEPVHFQRPGTP